MRASYPIIVIQRSDYTHRDRLLPGRLVHRAWHLSGQEEVIELLLELPRFEHPAVHRQQPHLIHTGQVQPAYLRLG